ncbi:MAG: hypothetical protein WAV21_03360 [Minisyncoccia bacterium]
MTNNPHQNEIQHEVLERIRSGELRMKPRLFFVLKAVLVVFVAALILLVSVWLASFISFGLRVSGHDSLLGFGTQGSLIFLTIFPWWSALLDLILIVLLGWLLRRFKFGYRRPLLYLFAVLIVGGIGAGLVFDRETHFNDDRFEEAEAGKLFGSLESLYESAHSRAPEEYGIYRGFVLGVGEDSFVLTHNDHDADEDDGTWTVLPPFGFAMEMLHTGDRVYVAGELEGNIIKAYGARILDR